MQWGIYILLLLVRLLTISVDVAVCRATSCPGGSKAAAAATEPSEPCEHGYRRKAGTNTKLAENVTLPATPTAPPEVTTFVYYFEGVDYTIHYQYQALAEDRNNCEALYIWCLRRGTGVHHVCGYNYWQWRYYSFYSLCELEIYNCLYRTQERDYGVYGTDHENDPVFYNGEGKECKFYYRRASSPDEMDYLYFGGNKHQVLASWIAQSRAQKQLAKQVEERGLEAIMEDEDAQDQGNDTELQDIPGTGQSEELDMAQGGDGRTEQNEQDEMERDQMELEQMVQDGHNMLGEIDQGTIENKNNLHDSMGQIDMTQHKMGLEGMRGTGIKQEGQVQSEREPVKQDEQNAMERLHREFDRKLHESNAMQERNRQKGMRQNILHQGMGQENMWQNNAGQNRLTYGQSGIGYNGYRQGEMSQGRTGVAQTGNGAMIPPGKAFGGMRYPVKQYRGIQQNGIMNKMGQSGIRPNGMWQGMGPAGQTTWQDNMIQRGVSQVRMGQGGISQRYEHRGAGQAAMGQRGMQHGGKYGQNGMQYQQRQ